MPVQEELLYQLRQRLDVPNVARVVLAESKPGHLILTINYFHHRNLEEDEHTYTRILTQDSNSKAAVKMTFKTVVAASNGFISALTNAKVEAQKLRKELMEMRLFQAPIVTSYAAERLKALIQYLEDAEVGGATRKDYRVAIQEARMMVEHDL